MSFFRNLKDKVSNHDKHASDQPRIIDSSENKNIKSKASHPQAEQVTSNPPSSAPLPSYEEAVPSSSENLPPYESWLAVPDNSQLPPPPGISNLFSSSNNATYESAEMGHKWCAKNPIYTPAIPRQRTLVENSVKGHLGLDPPSSAFKGSIRPLGGEHVAAANRTWEIETSKKQREDTILTSTLPIYFAALQNPLLPANTTSPHPITFSLSAQIQNITPSSTLAIGFTCKPYPSFRLPGWHRGSLAVHSDDGNRYINDPHGGIDFTSAFEIGETVRLKYTIFPRLSPLQTYTGKAEGVLQVMSQLPKCACRVEMERSKDGIVKEVIGWDVHEEKDGERDEGVEGLQGEADLYCAIGVCGVTQFVLTFGEQERELRL